MTLIEAMHIIGFIGTVCGLVLFAIWLAGRP